MIKVLEQAIAKVRTLPEDKQRLAAELLEELAASEQLYVLSNSEREALRPALSRAQNGEFASDEAVEALWQKCGL